MVWSPVRRVLLLAAVGMSYVGQAHAACGGTVRTWQGTTTTWATAANWSGTNIPDTSGEDAVVVASGGNNPNISSNQTVGCVDVQAGGLLQGTTNTRTLIVTGDYFRAQATGRLNITSNSNTGNTKIQGLWQ